MKYLFFLFFIPSAYGAQVLTTLLNDGDIVPANSSQIAEFYNRGNDIVHVVINGVDKGDIVYPYKVTYTSNNIGLANTFVVTTCDYMGRTATLNFSTMSAGRTFNKHKN